MIPGAATLARVLTAGAVWLGADRRAAETTFASDPAQWLLDLLGARAKHSGVDVTPATALQSSAVLACVRVSAETLGSLPLKLRRRLEGGGSEPATDHPTYALLHDSPNPWQTAMEFREMGQGHLSLRGNFYAEIIRDGGGRARELWPLHPDRVTPEVFSDVGLVYRVTVPAGKTSIPGAPIISAKMVRLQADQVLHIRGLSSDGILGLAPIQLAAEAIGLSLAAEAFGAGFFGRGATVSGLLTRDKEDRTKMAPETLTRLREQFQERYGGFAQSHRPLVLEPGMGWQQLGIPNNHAQFLETRDFQVGDIARIFRMPGVMIGYNDKTATYASAEQFFLAFVVHHALPWAVRWEQALTMKLLTPRERATLYFKFILDGLLRGDHLTRAQALQIRFQNGTLSPDEWREIEDQNPLPDGLGKKTYVMANLSPADAPRPAPAAAPAPAANGGALGRAARREIGAVRKAAERFAGDLAGWRAWVDDFYAHHALYVAEALEIPIDAARNYCQHHRAELLADGVSMLDAWTTDEAAELAALLEPKGVTA